MFESLIRSYIYPLPTLAFDLSLGSFNFGSTLVSLVVSLIES